MVFAVDRFELIQASQFPEDLPEEFLKSDKGFSFSKWKRLDWVWAKPPENSSESQTVLFNAIYAGVDISIMPCYYTPLLEAKNNILKRSLSLRSLYDFLEDKNMEVASNKEWLELNDRNDIVALPAVGRERSAILLVNKESMEYIDYIKLDPFKVTIWPKRT